MKTVKHRDQQEELDATAVFADLQDQLNMFVGVNIKHIIPRCRPPDRQPTITTGHHTTCFNLQSYAPDGQMFVQNMMSCS
jgi:hypothetical protein